MAGFPIVYIACIILHAAAFVFARRVWVSRESCYMNSRGGLKRILKSRREREFIIVGIGAIINIIFICVMMLYLFFLGGESAGWLEVWFCLLHFVSSIWTLGVHVNCWVEEEMLDAQSAA